MGQPDLTPHWEPTDTRMVATLLGVMLVMTVIALVLRAQAHTENRRRFATDFGARTLAWWVLVAIYIPATLAGGGVMLAVYGLTALLAWREFASLTGAAALRPPDLPWATLAVALPFLALARLLPGPVWLPATAGAGLIGVLAVVQGGRERLRWRLAGFGYCVLLVSLGPALALRFGSEYLFFIMVVVPAGDVFQYICGKLWGRRLLAPVLSPRKTWEGLIGGLIATALLGAALAPVIQAARGTGLLWGGALGLAGTGGGLLMSAVKRRWAAKDFGHLLPGQGGLMDRFDSLAAAYVAAWLLVYLGA